MKWDYFTRLTWAAYWQLPAADAEDVLSDYQDILRQKDCPEEELVKELGTPGQVIRLVSQPRAYHQWLVVFGILTACLLIPVAAAVFGSSNVPYFIPRLISMILFLPCIMLSFICFQRQSDQRMDAPFPQKLLFFLLLPVAGIVVAWIIIWWTLIDISTFFWLFETSGGRFSGHTIYILLSGVLFCSALTGELGLVGARLTDCRWRSLYVLSLTTILLCFSLMCMLTRMDVSEGGRFFSAEIWQYFGLTAVGLIGTGIALCKKKS